MPNFNKQPVLILGGFLINPNSYSLLTKWLRDKEGINAYIVQVNKLEWLLTAWEFGWVNILDKVDRQAKELTELSKTKKITLIGHSSGGVMLRIYLSDKKFSGRIYNGKLLSNTLITLGSPHQAAKATKLRALVDKLVPGSYYYKEVKYYSIGGSLNLNGNIAKKLSKRIAVNSYKSMSGFSDESGDGLVPLSSSLLKDSTKIVLKDVAHGLVFGKEWYGSKSAIENWWKKLIK